MLIYWVNINPLFITLLFVRGVIHSTLFFVTIFHTFMIGIIYFSMMNIFIFPTVLIVRSAHKLSCFSRGCVSVWMDCKAISFELFCDQMTPDIGFCCVCCRGGRGFFYKFIYIFFLNVWFGCEQNNCYILGRKIKYVEKLLARTVFHLNYLSEKGYKCTYLVVLYNFIIEYISTVILLK